ncbi:MAG: MoaD/ThiS family protein [Methanocorpusculum sp.]|nr:MoaD/ThiS family protein [Methanocorpusculum sp.]
MITAVFTDGNAKETKAGTVESVLRSLGLNPYEILVTRGDELLTADEILSDGDTVQLVSIVHGG